jgi:chemotaxis signal transduction protein
MGVPTTEIAEVLPKESLVSMPLTREDFSGVLLLRGVTHPVIDLREHFDLEAAENEDAMRTAIVLVKDGEEDRVGLLVQEVVQLSVLETRQIQNRDECRLEVHEDLIMACANLDIGQAGLLNVAEILQDERPSLRRNWMEAQDQMRRGQNAA